MKIIWSLIYIALVSILGHYVGELLPRTWFDYNRFPYTDFNWEERGAVYDKIKIKKWKTRLPDLSRVMKYMVPKRVSSKSTSEDIDRLLRETCVAEAVHWAVCVFAIGVCFISAALWGVLIWLAFTIINIPFILIQRYNRPHLKRLMGKMLLREERLREAREEQPQLDVL